MMHSAALSAALLALRLQVTSPAQIPKLPPPLFNQIHTIGADRRNIAVAS